MQIDTHTKRRAVGFEVAARKARRGAAGLFNVPSEKDLESVEQMYALLVSFSDVDQFRKSPDANKPKNQRYGAETGT